ncbi:PspC domain-containing protein [Arthrobacter sp. ATA002]|uniref:PspC domain-containing protein n=1 Tax=Arthrobacter sp. ATA002 TaxID=2991715 RepID=UPI0022A7DEDB|nr:PspC domain-containing protein [Arthrobacter sp. ATA002]WAP52537.1 PspC domain-containing protein [Arthrobacter sp. ATA002]
MTPHPSDSGPAPESRTPSAGSAGAETAPLPENAAPTRPLPPPAGAAGSHRIPPAGQEPEPGTGGFFTWLRSLRVVRGDDRWVGGVASGVAARLGLDPVLARGLFVVLGLFGVGLFLYGLAWALLPEPDGRIHAEEAVHGQWSSGTTGALVACFLGAGSPSIFWAGDGALGRLFWTLFWVVGAGLLVYWLTARSGSAGTAGGTDGRNDAGTAGGSGRPSGAPAPPDAPRSPSARPPQTRPAQAAPYAYVPPAADSVPPAYGTPSRPVRPAVPEPRRTSPAGPEAALVLGAVLMTLGTVLALDYLSLITLEAPAAVALAAAGVVNGLAIVVLGALGRSSGILGLTAAAFLVSAAATGTGIGAYTNVTVANQADWAPNSSPAATGGYALAAADGELDLRYFSDADRPFAEVPVSVAASDLTILVPDDIPVLVRTDMLAGNVVVDDGDTVTETGSIWRSSDRKLNGTGGDPLIVHVKGFASNVLVTVNESDLER